MTENVYTLSELEAIRVTNLANNKQFLADLEFTLGVIGDWVAVRTDNLQTLAYLSPFDGARVELYYHHYATDYCPGSQEYAYKHILVGYIAPIPGVPLTGLQVLRYSHTNPNTNKRLCPTDFIAPGKWQDGLGVFVQAARCKMNDQLDIAERDAIEKLKTMLCIGKEI